MDLDKLLPAEYNPRLMSNQQAKALTDSIGKFGDMSGVVFNRRSGRLVGGHQRREVFIKKNGRIDITETLDEPNEVGTVARGHILIGTEKFSYRVVDWDEPKEKLANLAANKISGDWDDDKLAELIYSLKDNGDLPDSGFTINEVTEILATVMDVGDDDADLTPPEKGTERTKLGDLWKLGDHRLLCGDSTISANYDELFENEEAEMVFTDPPYNVDYQGGAGGDWAKKKRRKAILNDKMEGQEFYNFLFSLCKNLLDHCRGGYYICMSSSELHTLHRAFTENGGHWQTYIIWAKNRFTLSRSDYQHQFEPVMYGLSEKYAENAENSTEYEALPIMYGWKDHHNWFGGRKQGDVWLIERPSKSPDHPTEKPVTLCARAIRNSSKRGDIVLDAFLGSGSTLVAAEQLQRRCYGMELEPGYCDVIIRRWEHLTGKKAKLIKNIGGNDGNQG